MRENIIRVIKSELQPTRQLDIPLEVYALPLDDVERLWSNPNSMSKEDFDKLKLDMQQHGPGGISPIVVADKYPLPMPKEPSFPGSKDQEKRYVCADGNHRLDAAIVLGWKEIRAIIDKNLRTELDLRMANYRKNIERGNTDPLKEARLFQWLNEQGKTHQKIADEFGVDRTWVTKRLSLLKIDEKVLSTARTIPNVTASHLEVIAPLEPALQSEVVKQFADSARYRPVSEGELRGIVKRAVEEKERKDKFQKVLDDPNSKFPKCPKCHKSAYGAMFGRSLPWVKCESYHEWNIQTGKGQEAVQASGPSHTRKHELPRNIRMEKSMPDFLHVFTQVAKSSLKDVLEIEKLECKGKAEDGGEFLLEIRPISFNGSVYSFELKNGKKQKERASFDVESKTYNTEALKKFKTSVSLGGQAPTKKNLEELEATVNHFFSRYSPEGGEKKGLSSEEVALLRKCETQLRSTSHTGQANVIRKVLELLL